VSNNDLLGKEFRLKEINDLRNVADAWQQGHSNLKPVTATSSFHDKYLNFSSSLHAHFVLRTRGKFGEVNACDLCAIFQRSPDVININFDGIAVVERIAEIDCPKKLSSDNQCAVFVDDVEFRNYPETAVLGLLSKVRSIVWLQNLNICECFRSNERFNLSDGLFEVGLTDTDREECISATRNIIPVENSQLANEMIQRRPEIVDNVADDKSPVGIIGSYFPMSENYVLPLRLVMDNEQAVFIFRSSPSVDSSLQLREMVVRSLDLVADSNEACTHD
jgi:hypothetical protein